MSSIAVLDDQFPLAVQGTIVRPGGIVRDSTPGPVPPDGALVENVSGQVSVVRGNGAVEQVGYADPLRQGDFLVVGGGSVTVVFFEGSRLRIVDSGQVLLKHVPHDAAPDDGSITLAAAGGHFQIVAGALGVQSPLAILVETPVALIHAGRSAFAFRHSSTDGLLVTMLEGIASATVVVENNPGTSIADPHHRIIVPGSDEAPIVDQAASQDVSAGSASPPDAPEGGNVEVSACGD